MVHNDCPSGAGRQFDSSSNQRQTKLLLKKKNLTKTWKSEHAKDKFLPQDSFCVRLCENKWLQPDGLERIMYVRLPLNNPEVKSFVLKKLRTS
jgi:hypothetical protein